MMPNVLAKIMRAVKARLQCRKMPERPLANILTTEAMLFEKYHTDSADTPAIFILAAPRTGSTVFYQIMAKLFGLHYFSNFVDTYYSSSPFLGTVLENALIDDKNATVTLNSRYGQTENLFEPSEATKTLREWFHWEHPSQTHAASCKEGKRDHLQQTLGGLYAYMGRPIVIKNAWNCFRVKELSGAFPNAFFIWLRRDVADSAYSDLVARRTKGDPAKVWNSATTADYKEIQQRPYTEQVVEQQISYNRAIETDLQHYVPASHRFELWYEDLANAPHETMTALAKQMKEAMGEPFELNSEAVEKIAIKRSTPKNDDSDFIAILDYAQSHHADHLYQGE